MFGLNPAMSNIAVMLIMMQVSRNIDMENPDILFYVRVVYGTMQALTMGVYLFTKMKISAKNDMTTLKYVQPANTMAGETEPKAVVTTVKEYDLQQVDTQIKGVFQALAMMGFMHLYMKYTNPLVMQSISGIKGALESNIMQIHLFGTPATGDLKRPFKQAPGLMAALTGAGAGDVKTDKASVESAEISGSGGIKED